jgi:colanic acid/amylovoran biosynthesis glycosyltransferase
LRIGYITNTFPVRTETFIYREVVALRKSGFPVETFSIRHPGQDFSSEAEHLVQETFYILPVGLKKFLQAHLFFAAISPGNYIRSMFFVLSRRLPNWRDRLRTFFHFCEAVYLAKVMKERKIEHIHAHYASHSCTIALAASQLLHIPFSFTAHAYDIWLDQLMLKEKLDKCQFAVTCSGYGKQFLLDTVDSNYEGKIHVVHHGVDPEAFTMPRAEKRAEPTVVSVGRLHEQKGLPYLIEACHLLLKKGITFKCFIIGDGELKSELQQKITERGLENVVILTGSLDQHEVKNYYGMADLFVLPSVIAGNGDRDGIPNVLIEAMSMGLPVVSTTISGIPELVQNELTGLLVEPRDSESLANAMARLFQSSELRGRMGQRGRDYVRERFDINKNVKDLIDLFKRYTQSSASV